VDTPARWEITLRLHEAAPVPTATADAVPRRLQTLAHAPGTAFLWENRQQPDHTLVQSGSAVADANGLISLPSLLLTKPGNRIALLARAPAVLAVHESDSSEGGRIVRVLLRSPDIEFEAAQLDLTFEATATLAEVRLGRLVQGWTLEWQSPQPTRIQCQLAGAPPVRGVGDLLVLTFRSALGASASVLTATLNQGRLPVRIDAAPGAFEGDTDGDGQADLAEIRAGTDPSDRGSLFRLIQPWPQPADRAVVTWTTVPGKRYQVERTDHGLPGVWLDLGPPVAADAPAASLPDPTAAHAPARFYRVRLLD